MTSQVPRRGALTLPQVPRRGRRPGVELTLRAGRDGAVAGDPWPFADAAVDLPVAARNVPGRRYASAGDLAAELSRSAWITREFRLQPA